MLANEVATLATDYADTRNDARFFSFQREHMHELRELRKRTDIVITRPDKGRATVILDKSDYLEKMATILDDTSKFEKLGPASDNDNTQKVEKTLCAFLQKLVERGHLSAEVFDAVKPSGSVRPRLYGLPKVHKNNCPLRPIVSMSGSPQYRVSQWLCDVLEPVLKLYNSRSVKDTFEFVDMVK